MSPSAYVLLFALTIGGFTLALIALILLLTVFRQRRARRLYPASTTAAPEAAAASEPEPVPAPATEPKLPALSGKTIAMIERLPIRESSPDEVVIQIDVPQGPSQAQVNVQRLIDHLKRDTVAQTTTRGA